MTWRANLTWRQFLVHQAEISRNRVRRRSPTWRQSRRATRASRLRRFQLTTFARPATFEFRTTRRRSPDLLIERMVGGDRLTHAGVIPPSAQNFLCESNPPSRWKIYSSRADCSPGACAVNHCPCDAVAASARLRRRQRVCLLATPSATSGRPKRLPLARALRRPALTRSWMSERSNSAIAPMI